MSLSDDLIALVGRAQVADDEATRDLHSHDASIFQTTPEVVVVPRDAQDVAHVVRYASGHSGVAIVARGGGTDMGGGAIGSSIIMDVTRHMHAFVDVGRDTAMAGQDGYATAQPGMWYRDFERATMSRGMFLPSYPASREICTLGGMVANNSGGERSLAYGKTARYMRSIQMVCADGNIYEFGPMGWPALEAKMAQQDWEGQLYRQMYDLAEKHHDAIQAARPNVSKNSSGYALWDIWDRTTFNLAKLICGSQGTLGVITQATVGLVRPKPRRAMVVAFLKDIAPVADVAHALGPFKPESLESFDDKTLSFTLRFLPDYIKRLGARNIFSLARQFLPEVWMLLTGGLPKLIVLAEFSGDDGDEVQGRAAQALATLKSLGIKAHMTHDEQEAHKYWVIRRESFNVLRNHTTGKRTTPFIDDFIVKPEHMPEFLTKLYEILKPYELTLTIAGHIGDGNFHIIPLMDLRDERVRRLIVEIADKVYGLVLEYHGSITAEHNDGLIRGPYVERMFGADIYDLFRQVKHLWDPKNIFNPGKKIDVDWQWALAHIRKD